jgi:hypothetical protein
MFETTNRIMRATTIECRVIAEALRDRCEALSEMAEGDEIASPAGWVYRAGIYASEAAAALDESQACLGMAMDLTEEVEGRKPCHS